MAQGEDSTRTSRVRVCAGLLAVILGCYLAGDVAHRARAALDFGARWWPWVLLGLAAVNLVRSALPTGSLIGPSLLVCVALAGLVTSDQVSARALTNLALPGLLALGGCLLLLGVSSTGPRSSWSRVLTTGRVVVPHGSGKTVTVRAVLGELRADLTGPAAAGRTTVHVTAVAGHIRMTVPRDRRVRVHSSGAFLTRVVDSGPKPTEVTDPSTGLTIHVLAMCSVVGIIRV
jgi:hypothetical protein